EQNCYENGSADQADPGAFAHRDGPGEEKQGFNVEEHEKNRDQIKLCGETQACIAGGENGGFEWLVLGAAPGLAADAAGYTQHESAQGSDAQPTNSDAPVMGQCGIRHAELLVRAADDWLRL